MKLANQVTNSLESQHIHANAKEVEVMCPVLCNSRAVKRIREGIICGGKAILVVVRKGKRIVFGVVHLRKTCRRPLVLLWDEVYAFMI